MGSRHLFVAGSTELFVALGQGPKSLGELAHTIGVQPRTVQLIAEALISLGLLEKLEDRYRNGPAVEAFLAETTTGDLRPFSRFWDRFNNAPWMDLETCIRTAKGDEPGRRASEDEARILTAGVAAATLGSAQALLTSYDWSRHQLLLDLGGGTGSFLRILLGAHRTLRGTLLELPEVAALARSTTLADLAEGRIDILEGSFFERSIPTGHDVVLLANVVHVLSAEQNLELFRRVRASVATGVRLLLVDIWLDPEGTTPSFGSLRSGDLVVLTGEGEFYSAEQVREWLRESGWNPLDQRPLAGPASLLIAEAA
jgi:O-methyltransferase domain/Dimerisation domain